LCEAIRAALQTPIERLEAMGEMGALRVRQDHCALTEAAKLSELFFSAQQAGNVPKATSFGTLRNLNGPQGLRNRKNLTTGN
jgi:hypothetical protein